MLIGGGAYSPSDTMYAVAPINKNIAVLGWKSSISLEDGIKILYEDIKKHML